MPSQTIKTSVFSEDVLEFISLLRRFAVRFLWALEVFWNYDIPGVSAAEELLERGVIIQFGRPPNRIDLHNHWRLFRSSLEFAGRHPIEGRLTLNEAPLYWDQSIASKQTRNWPGQEFG